MEAEGGCELAWRANWAVDPEQLKELGEKLQAVAPAPADELAKLLEKVVECLHGIEQSPGSSMMEAIQPSLKAVTREELLKHEDDNVKVLLATCFCEITRITAPVVPYNDDILRDMFYLIVGTFGGLRDVNSQYFGRRVDNLEMFAGCRLCVVMLDLECDDLIADMFQTFLGVVSDSHEENIVKSMQTIMILIIDESEEVEESLLRVLLSALVQKKTGAAMSARKLARSVIELSAKSFEPYIKKFLTSSSAGNGSSSNDQIDHQGIVFDLYQCVPKVHKVIVLGDNIDLYQCVPKAERSGKGEKENVIEGIVIRGDSIEKIIKVQQDQKVEDEKVTEAQIQISNANLKAAKEQKEAKMFEVYNSLIIQGTRHMSEDQKASRDRALRKLEEKLFAA